MKKIILLIAVAFTTILIAEDKLTTVQLDQIKELNSILRSPTVKIKEVQDLQSVYFLKMEAMSPRGPAKKLEGFLDKKTGALYIGYGYDKTGKKFLFPVNVKAVDEAVAFTYGAGEKELYLVSDPECPYCTKFAKQAEGQLKEYTIHVILFPLSFHKNAKAMTHYIIAGKDDMERTKRYKEIVLNENTAYRKTKVDARILNTYLDKSNAAVYELDVGGTPSLFIKEGNSFKKATWKEILQN